MRSGSVVEGPIESSYYSLGDASSAALLLIVSLMRILHGMMSLFVLVGFLCSSVAHTCSSSGSRQMQPQSSERFREVSCLLGG